MKFWIFMFFKLDFPITMIARGRYLLKRKKKGNEELFGFKADIYKKYGGIMEFFDVIKRRGSYRGEFENSSIPPEDLKIILDAGICAPSGYNLQTTTFYAVTDREIRKKFAEIFPTEATQFAPAIIVVTSKCIHAGDYNLEFEIEDYAASTENIMLAITAMGYAGVWMDGMMKFEGNIDKVRKLLNISCEETPRTIIPFGKPKSMVTQKEKKGIF